MSAAPDPAFARRLARSAGVLKAMSRQGDRVSVSTIAAMTGTTPATARANLAAMGLTPAATSRATGGAGRAQSR